MHKLTHLCTYVIIYFCATHLLKIFVTIHTPYTSGLLPFSATMASPEEAILLVAAEGEDRKEKKVSHNAWSGKEWKNNEDSRCEQTGSQ